MTDEPRPPISRDEGIARKAAINFANGILRIKEDAPPPEVAMLNRRFIAGEITNQERIIMLLAIRRGRAT